MNPMTIQCDRCATHLVLTASLLERVWGRSGRVTCQGCGEKIGVDARDDSLALVGAQLMPEPDLELDGPAVLGGAQLSLVPPPPSSLPHRVSLHPVPRPPRPSIGARPSVPPPASTDPFDPLGSLAPVVPLQGVRLTEDGRLVNSTDEAPAAKSRSRVRTWAPILMAALLGTGLASARVGSMLPLRRSAPVAKAITVPSPVDAAPAAGAVPSPKSAAPALADRAPVDVAPELTEKAETSTARATEAEGDRNEIALTAANEPADQGDSAQASSSEATPAAEEPSDDVASEAVAADAGQAEANPADPASADGAADSKLAGDTATDAASVDVALDPEFSKDAASVALQHAAAEALSCRQAGDPAGSARVVVTFAPSGRVTSANINGAPYAGTATGGCIASRFRGATVPAFVGGYVTVSKTIALQ